MKRGFCFTSWTVIHTSSGNKDPLVCYISILQAKGFRDNCFSHLRQLKLDIFSFHIIRNGFDTGRTNNSRVFWIWIRVTYTKWSPLRSSTNSTFLEHTISFFFLFAPDCSNNIGHYWNHLFSLRTRVARGSRGTIF